MKKMRFSESQNHLSDRFSTFIHSWIKCGNSIYFKHRKKAVG
jgi:hypothetical protein